MLKSLITKKIQKAILSSIENIEKEVSTSIKSEISYKIKIAKRKIMKDLFSAVIIIMAIGLLSISLIAAIAIYLKIEGPIPFALVGIILLIAGIIIKISN